MAASDDEIPDLFPNAKAAPPRPPSRGSDNKKSKDEGPSAVALLDLDGPAESLPPPGSAKAEPAPAPLRLDLATEAPLELDLSAQAPPPSQSVDDGAKLEALGGGPTLDDNLDDLEFGGAASQLNVEVDIRDPEKDVPWPTGRTPFADEISPDLSAAKELAAFGDPPSSAILTPLYFWKVFSRLKELEREVSQAQRKLNEAEFSRDMRLAELAESMRAELSNKERFSALYSKIGEHEAAIDQKQKDLKSSGAAGATALDSIAEEIGQASSLKDEKQNLRDLESEEADKAKKQIARHSAALKRVDIQYRNLQQRLDKEAPGQEVPAEFEELFQKFDLEKEAANARLAESRTHEKEVLAQLRDADLALGKAAATHQAKEGKMEALLITQEGDHSQHHQGLNQASLERQTELADAARILLELKGQVPVKSAVREQITQLDEAVYGAFIHSQNMTSAQASMDEEAYGTGKYILIAAALGLVGLLAWSVI